MLLTDAIVNSSIHCHVSFMSGRTTKAHFPA